MLRIAVPNKGSLSEAACEMLHEAGYRQRKDRELLVADPASGAEPRFLDQTLRLKRFVPTPES